MSTESPNSSTPEANSDTNDLYFPAFGAPIAETESHIEGITTLLEDLKEAHDLARTIDCDYGCAVAERDDDVLTIKAHVPEITGPADTLVSLLDWDERDISYDTDNDLYTIELTYSVPTIAPSDLASNS